MDAFEAAVAFGLGDALESPVIAARGELGRIWKVTTRQGRFAVKEPLEFVPAQPEAEIEANVAFQELMLAAGVPIPRPLRAHDGRPSVNRWRVYEWMDLAVYTGPPQAIGALLARMHAASPESDVPPDPWYVAPVELQTWEQFLDRARLVAPRPLWLDRLAALVPEMVAANRLLDFGSAPGPGSGSGSGSGSASGSGSDRTRRLCHLDVCGENIGSAPQHPLVVFDWENASAALPRHELCATMWDIAVEDSGDPFAIWDGYRAAGGDSRRLQATDFSIALATQANRLVLYGQRALEHPEPGDEVGERARWRVEEVLARPLTRAAIDGLLDDQARRPTERRGSVD